MESERMVGRTTRDTSIAAWEAIKPRAKNLREEVYAHILNTPSTSFELESKGYHRSTASTRITELAKAGRIRDTGERRKTPTGRRAIVWEAVAE